MELFDDYKRAENQLAALARGWDRIDEQLEFLAEYWPKMCNEKKGFKSSLESVSTAPWKMNGKVLEKAFSILITPLATEGEQGQEIYAELLVLMPSSLNGGMVETARILLDKELAVYSATGRKLAEGGEGSMPFRLLVSILNQVLSAKTA